MDNSLIIFNEIANKLLADEEQNPVSEFISSDELFDQLDIDLSDNPIDEERFKKALEDLVLKTPKTAKKLT